MTSEQKGLHLPVFQKFVNLDSSEKYKCKVKEPLTTMYLYWMMYTVNRVWLMDTIERIHQSGLKEKIVVWADWAYIFANMERGAREFVEDRDAMNKPVVEPDLIEMHKLFVPIAFLAIGVVMAVNS